MRRWRLLLGPLLIAMGLLHTASADWATLRRMLGRGWWLSADTAQGEAATWFLAAGFALIVLGLAVNALVRAGLPIPLSVGIGFGLLMAIVFAATGALGALIGIVMGGVLIAAALLPAPQRPPRHSRRPLDPDTV